MANEVRLIDCRDCDSKNCNGCNVFILQEMLDRGELKCLMDETKTIAMTPGSLRPKGRWEWFEEWIPSTPDHPLEFIDCGWRCSECKDTLENMVGGYWDDLYDEPKLHYCPNCGAKMEG